VLIWHLKLVNFALISSNIKPFGNIKIAAFPNTKAGKATRQGFVDYDDFILEKSTDNIDFKKIGRIEN
jgi:hypothetical protein